MGDVSELAVKKYGHSITMLAQQTNSRIRGACMPKPMKGKTAFFNRIQAVEANERTERLAQTKLIDPAMTKRRVSIRPWDIAMAYDVEADEPENLADVQGTYVQTAIASLRRASDDVIIKALGAASVTEGEDDTEATVTFPAGQQIASTFGGSASNLTVDKLIEIKRIFRANDIEIDAMMPNIVIGASQEAAMFKSNEFTSFDYSQHKPLSDGRAAHNFMGFNWYHSQRLPITTGTVRRIYAWVTLGMGYAYSKDLRTSADKRPDLNNAWQVHAAINHGSVRIQDTHVVWIDCDEA